MRSSTTYDAAALVLVASPTLRIGLQRAFRYQVLWGDGERFSIRADPVTFDPGLPHRRAHEIITECALLEVLGAVRALVNHKLMTLREPNLQRQFASKLVTPNPELRAVPPWTIARTVPS